MSFSAAVTTQQQYPAFQVLGVLPGNLKGCVQRLCLFGLKLTSPAGQEALKSHVFIGFEVTQAVQAVLSILDGGLLPAGADLKLAKVWMFNREVAAHKPDSATNWTVGVAQGR